jgi:hypothetical protein
VVQQQGAGPRSERQRGWAVYFGEVGDGATGTSNLRCLDETQDRDVNTMEFAGAFNDLGNLLPPGSVDVESRQGP